MIAPRIVSQREASLLKAQGTERTWCQPAKEPGCAGDQAKLDVETTLGTYWCRAPHIAVPRALQAEAKGVSCPSHHPLRWQCPTKVADVGKKKSFPSGFTP